ncbi:MAG: hypothetical protein QOH58_2510 [Thermoleophilaceae bacterium]|nr:hypothetical protein [Thermoleophilaceae bacterium]
MIEPDVLDTGRAGGLAIRGGLLRTVGYVAALMLSLVSVPFMTRHLGVVDYGHFVTVSSVVFIVGGITEAGLTNLGTREFAVLEPSERDAFLRNLAGLRFVLTAVGITAATAILLVTGAERVVVEGSLIAGLGLLLSLTQQTYAIPLSARLRLGWVTTLELLKQAVLTATILALVVAGAGLIPFFGTTIASALVVLVLTLLVIRHEAPLMPAADLAAWRRILRDVLPYAAAVAVGIIYFRVAVILLSYISSDYQTGIYSTAFRVVETVGVVPWLVVSAGFPILARAARDDRERLRYALQRLFEVALIIGAAFALALALSARFAIDVIAGLPEFEDSVPVLRLLALAAVSAFLVATSSLALLSLREHTALLVCNAVAGVVAIVGTVVLAGQFDAMGAAVATFAAEATLAVAYLLALARRREGLAPQIGVVPKVLLAAAAGAAAALLPAHPLVQTFVGLTAYAAVLFATRAVPPELLNALLRRDP